MQSIEIDRAMRAPDELNRSLADKIQEFEEEADRILSDARWAAYADRTLAQYDMAVAVEAAAHRILGGAWRQYQDARLGAIATLDAAASAADAAYTRATDPRKYQGLGALQQALRAELALLHNAEDVANAVAEFARRSAAHAAAAYLDSGHILATADALAPQHAGDAAKAKSMVEKAVQDARERAFPGAGGLAAARDRYRQAILSLSSDAHVRRTLYHVRRRKLGAVVGTTPEAARHSIRRGPRVAVSWGSEWDFSPDSWLKRRPEEEIRIERGRQYLQEPVLVGRPEVRR